jgi:hypothetical protein
MGDCCEQYVCTRKQYLAVQERVELARSKTDFQPIVDGTIHDGGFDVAKLTSLPPPSPAHYHCLHRHPRHCPKVCTLCFHLRPTFTRMCMRVLCGGLVNERCVCVCVCVCVCERERERERVHMIGMQWPL